MLCAVEAIAGRSGRKGQTWSTENVLVILGQRYGMADTVELLHA